jgi:hypothetical protein
MTLDENSSLLDEELEFNALCDGHQRRITQWVYQLATSNLYIPAENERSVRHTGLILVQGISEQQRYLSGSIIELAYHDIFCHNFKS